MLTHGIMVMDTFPDIPGYRTERQLGSGAMATVYLAIQTSLERPVALKVMAASLVADPSFCERFLKEGRIIAQLIHPNVVTIYDIGVVRSCYYMAMEYVADGTLTQRIKDGLSEEQTVNILCQVARALGYAHRRGFLHRDIKPANVLFREDGTAVLSDFGIAKALGSGTQLTAVGWTVGTPNYMSPEQALGKPLDARCDLYSLGIVFYEMLTGVKPYQSSDSFATALMHLNSPVPRLPERFAAYQEVLDKLLAKDAGDRFASAEELIKAVEQVRASRTAPAPAATRVVPSAARVRPARPVRGSRYAAWLLGLGMLTSLAGAGLYLLLPEAPRPPLRSESPAPSRPTDTPAPAAPLPAAPLDTNLQKEIAQLLLVAKAHQDLDRLTEPPGSNAAYAYQRVLQFDPDNAEARAGLKAIADTYAARARESLARGESLRTSLELVEAGLSVMPDDAALRALEAQIKQTIRP